MNLDVPLVSNNQIVVAVFNFEERIKRSSPLHYTELNSVQTETTTYQSPATRANDFSPTCQPISTTSGTPESQSEVLPKKRKRERNSMATKTGLT